MKSCNPVTKYRGTAPLVVGGTSGGRDRAEAAPGWYDPRLGLIDGPGRVGKNQYHLIALSDYLRASDSIAAHPEVQGGWKGKLRVLLEGGPLVLQKPAEGSNAPGASPDEVINREAAAWVVANALGWAHLVAATVVRDPVAPVPGQPRSKVSIQILWPEPTEPIAALDQFDELDLHRAAVFDWAIVNTDRRQNNWLATGPDLGGQKHLHLYDHGNAFMYGHPVASSFVEHIGTQQIPATVCDEITVGLGAWPMEELSRLLGAQGASLARDRFSSVCTNRRLVR